MTDLVARMERFIADVLSADLTPWQREALRMACGMCEVCGKPTSTPPECALCQIRDDAAAVRRADR